MTMNEDCSSLDSQPFNPHPKLWNSNSCDLLTRSNCAESLGLSQDLPLLQGDIGGPDPASSCQIHCNTVLFKKKGGVEGERAILPQLSTRTPYLNVFLMLERQREKMDVDILKYPMLAKCMWRLIQIHAFRFFSHLYLHMSNICGSADSAYFPLFLADQY